MAIETVKDFAAAIAEHADRMETGVRQRMASGELVGWVTCECGISIHARYLAFHKLNGARHFDDNGQHI